MNYFKALSHILIGDTEVNHEESQSELQVCMLRTNPGPPECNAMVLNFS